MSPPRDPEGIRPSLKLLAAFCVGLAALTLYLAVSPEASTTSPRGGARAVSAGSPPQPAWRGPSEGRRHWTGAAWSADPEDGPSWAEGPTRPRPGDDDQDPQVRAMHRSMGGADSGVDPEFWPTTRTGRLARVSGELPVPEGATCEVRVLPVRTHRFNCLIKVSCDGVVIYPEPELHAGYVSCDLAGGVPKRAVDDGVSGEDGDPTVDFDLDGRRVVISDARGDGRSFAAELVLN